MKRQKLFWTILLTAIICFLFTTCNLDNSNEQELVQSTDSIASEFAHYEGSPAVTTPSIPITPGDLSIMLSDSDYWGAMVPLNSTLTDKPNPPSPRDVLYDYIRLKMSGFIMGGYSIRLDLYKNFDDITLGEEKLDSDISADELMKKVVDYYPAAPKQLIIIYVGERNEVSIYSSPDVPEINLDAIKKAFQDEAITDHIMRIMVAVRLLWDEMVSVEMVVS